MLAFPWNAPKGLKENLLATKDRPKITARHCSSKDFNIWGFSVKRLVWALSVNEIPGLCVRAATGQTSGIFSVK